MAASGSRSPNPAPRRRMAAVAAIFAAVLALYVVALVWLDVSFEPNEQEFGMPMSAARVWIYMQVVAVDAVNDTIQIRISILPPKSSHGEPQTVADRDMTLVIYRETSSERIQVHAKQAFPEVTMNFDLQTGSIRYYPLDRYGTLIHFASFEGAVEGDARSAMPVHVTTWEGVLGYIVRAEEHALSEANGHMELQFTVARMGAVAFFGLAAYFAMMVLAVCGLTIGTLVVCRVRKIEATLFGAVGAIVFALPAVRSNLPGSPPLGVWGDVLVFFWAELAAVFGLCLLVVAWTRGGAKP